MSGRTCHNCGFDLVGRERGRRCPECGRRPPNEFLDSDTRGRATRSLLLGLTCAVIALPAVISLIFAPLALLAAWGAVADGWSVIQQGRSATLPKSTLTMAWIGLLGGVAGGLVGGLLLTCLGLAFVGEA